MNSTLRLKIVLSLLVLVLFLGCKKENKCNDVVQGDFELVE
ncbi:hypothetical protein [Pedobacter cryophilus]|nr:hypothetical protein [Pedobacter cryophilus]